MGISGKRNKIKMKKNIKINKKYFFSYITEKQIEYRFKQRKNIFFHI